MRLTTVALFAWLAASAASAQAMEPQRALERLARIAEAERLIAAAEAQGHLIPGEEDGMAVARHPASGLVCRFELGDSVNRIMLFPDLPAGDDVGCSSEVDGVYQTVFATRYGDGRGLTEALQAAMNEAAAAYAETAPFEVNVDMMIQAEADGVPLQLPDYRATHFVLRHQGRQFFSRIAIAVVGEWVIKQRVTGPLEEADDLIGRASVLWGVTLAPFARPQIADTP